jgi:hypothetical protein
MEADRGAVGTEGRSDVNDSCILRAEAFQECRDVKKGCRAEDYLREEGPEAFQLGCGFIGLPGDGDITIPQPGFQRRKE